jgi:Fe-S-cluster containining protein
MSAVDEDFAQLVRAAGRRPQVSHAVHALYDDVEAEIAAARPVCIASGRCCHFEEYGHRLYVTTIELATFWADETNAATHSPRPSTFTSQLSIRSSGPAAGIPTVTAGGCAFQIGKLCGVHTRRPMGCRIFHCDANWSVSQPDRYERFHARLKALHADLDVPYHYMEWRHALAITGLGP